MNWIFTPMTKTEAEILAISKESIKAILEDNPDKLAILSRNKKRLRALRNKKLNSLQKKANDIICSQSKK